MSRKIFVNLPVADLPKSIAYYEALGFTRNPHFSDDTAACMVISEENYVMLLTHPKFKDFVKLPLADAKKTVGMLVAISFDSKEAVDAVAATAKAHGGAEHRPAQDLGFMYSRSISDPDGHIWEPFWMDPAAIPAS
jgi:uncharacterized protein